MLPQLTPTELAHLYEKSIKQNPNGHDQSVVNGTPTPEVLEADYKAWHAGFRSAINATLPSASSCYEETLNMIEQGKLQIGQQAGFQTRRPSPTAVGAAAGAGRGESLRKVAGQ